MIASGPTAITNASPSRSSTPTRISWSFSSTPRSSRSFRPVTLKREQPTRSGLRWRKMPSSKSSAEKITKTGWPRMTFPWRECMALASESTSRKHRCRRSTKNKLFFDQHNLLYCLHSWLDHRIFILFANRFEATLAANRPALADVLAIAVKTTEN